MTPLARIAVAALFAGALPAAAQTLSDDATVAASSAEERHMANEARDKTRSAIGTVFGAGQGAAAGAPAPAAPAPAAGSAPAIAAPPDVGAPTGENAWNAATEGVADAVPPDAVAPEAAVAGADPRRDPFRPFTLSFRAEPLSDEGILSPLQRFELPQLRLAAVVLDASPPRAMLQDNSGMGFIVTPGTPIGRRHGVVKSIEPRRIVVEELVLDYYGRQQSHLVVIEMPSDDKQAQEKP